MNPRNDRMFRDRGHRLLRRGIPFGPPTDRQHPDDRERGMIFNAYMAGIEDQFEFLQRRWANDPKAAAGTLAAFGRPSTAADGFDPVIGNDADTARRRHGEDAVKDVPPLAFGGFVTTTGSVYAFAPARTALRALAGEEPLG